MSTLLQMLRVAFWMWPLQKVLTLLGLAIAVFAIVAAPLFPAPRGGNLPLLLLGFVFMVFPVVVAGGALWRMLSGPRIVTLAPHGRGRLLAGALAVLIAACLIWTTAYAIYFYFQVPSEYWPGPIHYYRMFMLSLAFGTLWGLGSFFASLSPWSMLITLLALNAPGFVLRHYGIENMGHVWGSGWGPPVLVAIWTGFALWYLRTRRLESPRWMVTGQPARNGLALTANRPPRDRNEGINRLLLAGSSPLQQALVWTAAILLLLGIQLLVARLHGNESPDVTVRLAFANMILGACALMFAGARVMQRVRSAWLVSGELRADLFRRAERLMLRTALLLALFIGALSALLFVVLRPLPPSTSYLAAAMALWGLWACYVSLNMLRPGWNLLQLLLLGAFLAALVFMLMGPLFSAAGTRPWGWLVVIALAVVGTREIARIRWMRADLPRAPATSWASGT